IALCRSWAEDCPRGQDELRPGCPKTSVRPVATAGSADVDPELLQAIAKRSEADVEQLGRALADPACAIERGEDQRALEVGQRSVEIDPLDRKFSTLASGREQRGPPLGEVRGAEHRRALERDRSLDQ